MTAPKEFFGGADDCSQAGGYDPRVVAVAEAVDLVDISGAVGHDAPGHGVANPEYSIEPRGNSGALGQVAGPGV